MSVHDKIDKAQPTTWLTNDLTDVEIAVMEERVKWLKALVDIKAAIRHAKSEPVYCGVDDGFITYVRLSEVLAIIDIKSKEIEDNE